MPLSLILAIVVAGVGLIAVAGAKAAGQSRRTVTAVFAVLIGLLVFSASFTFIGARTVGVETNLGQPVYVKTRTGLVAPWHKVEKFDASTQTLIMSGDSKNDDNDGPAVQVRLGNQTTAQVDITKAQWNVNPEGDVLDLYRRYRKFGNIEKNVVAPQVANSLTKVFGTFDPLASVNGTADAKVTTTTNLADQALRDVNAQLGSSIKLTSLLIFVRYDGTTQAKLNGYAQALADTRIATQGKLTAQENAAANRALTETKDGKPDDSYKEPGVQYQACLNLVKDLATRDQLKNLPPATLDCAVAGGTAASTRSQLLVQSRAR